MKLARSRGLLACFLFSLFFGPEDGGSTFLQNNGELIMNYPALCPRRVFFLVTAVRISNPTLTYGLTQFFKNVINLFLITTGFLF
jgi:hypothetical protein